MQLNKVFSLDSATFIDKKRVAIYWKIRCGEKVIRAKK
jgi:hypothetical protein